MTGLTLDAGALIAVERGDRSFAALLARTRELGGRITIPASALAQAMRSPVRQVRLVRLCRHQTTDLIPLDGPEATAVGLLLADTHTADIVDAHVVICARRARQVVVTSDHDDIARLAPDLTIVSI
jgi:hypothetical protein